MRAWAFAALAFVVSCATPPAPTLADLDGELSAKRAASTRTFTATRAEVFAAIGVVLDGMSNDFEYSAHDRGLAATRAILYTLGIANVAGRDWWSFQIAEAGDTVTLTVSARTAATSGIFVVVPPRSFEPEIPVQARDGLSPIEVTMFMDRLAYALGEGDSWPVCADVITTRDERQAAALMCNGGGLNERPPAPPRGAT